MIGLKRRSVLIVVGGLAVLSCGPATEQGKATKLDVGISNEIAANTYRFEAFDLTITAPEGWFVADAARVKTVIDEVEKRAADENVFFVKQATRPTDARGEFFGFFQYDPRIVASSNPSVVGAYENVKSAPSIKSGADYCRLLKKNFARSELKGFHTGEIRTRKIDDQEFAQMDVQMRLETRSCDQSYYATRKGDFVLLILLSYNSSAERLATEAVLDSIKLAW